MQILIGCAKDMRGSDDSNYGIMTEPRFAGEAMHNALQMAGYDEAELADMLHCNADIARQNRLRYMHFAGEGSRLQAVLAYTGVVYKYLDAQSFTPDDKTYAQEHLWITSFLYGLLRPADMIKPYRLEGNVVLPDNGVSMFDYWKPLLTDVLIDSVKASGGLLVDLASSEMRRLFNWRKVAREVDVVRPEFYVNKGGRLKTIVIYAKICRGAMTRYLLQNCIENADKLKSFDFEGFSYSEVDSKPGCPVFVSNL